MENLLNTASPLIALIATAVVAFVIYASRKSEVATFLIVAIVVFIGLLIYHSVYLNSLPANETELISQAYYCIAIDLVLFLISFISYLWVDDIVAKKKKLKSYDDSLSWFWDKI